MQIISIITDNKGNIINNANSVPFFQLALTSLEITPNQKKLLINTFDKNYSICKIPFEINACLYFQYILEEWRIGNNPNIVSSKNIIESNLDYKLLNTFGVC